MFRMPDTSPVIFIHGFIGTLQAEALETPHATPDLLGYGAYRTVPFDSISLPAQVEHIREYVESRFGAGPVDIVGHSLGGAIAMLFAHAYPERVRRIVNVEGNFTLDDAFWSASVGRMSPEEADLMLAGFRADPLAWLRKAVADPTPAMVETAIGWLNHQPGSRLRAMGRSVIVTTGEAGYLSMLREVFQRHPVYLLCGEHSRGGWNVPDWALEACADQQMLEGCGHMMMLERPDAFAASIRRYLRHAER